MQFPLTLDEIVRTSDDEAVRARFDAGNRRSLKIISALFVFFGFIETVAGLAMLNAFRFGLALASTILGAVVFIALRKGKPSSAARLLERRTAASVIAFMTAQMVLTLLYHAHDEGVIAFAAMMPFMLISMRMLPAELGLMHGLVAVISIVIRFLAPYQKGPAGPAFIAIAIIMNAMPLALELFASRRMRREVVAQWTERRSSAREQVRMRDELRYARELQLSMLPDAPPAVSWLDVAATSIPAAEVGGDYFDYVVSDDRVAIVCGDVAGHGLSSGIVLAALRAGLTLLRDSFDQPARVLARLHELVRETSRRRILVSCSVLLIDRAAGRAAAASAGHPPIIVRHADGRTETLDLYAPPLGVRLPFAAAETSFDIRQGDVFVLHSDGIYEAQNDAGESYGFERLLSVVAAATGDAASLRDGIIADVERFRGSAPQLDDMTVVVAALASLRT